MAKRNEIAHECRIVEITPDFTTVEIIASSACSACHAKTLCGMSEDKEKLIMVPTDGFRELHVGDQVTVMTKMSMGLKAVWISYVIPLAVLMILILTLSVFWGDSAHREIIAGLGALGGVAVYYLVVWLLRGKLQNEFVFYIK